MHNIEALTANITLRRFTHRAEMAAAVCEDIAEDLHQQLVSSEQNITLIVSGGKSPLAWFSALSHKPLDWSRITIALADERWVPANHVDSNQRLIRENLLINRAQEAQFIPFVTDCPTLQQAEQKSAEALNALLLPAQIVVLGMGEDGHTASLFPHAPELTQACQETVKRCMGIHPLEGAYARLTLTAQTLLQSRRIIIPINGDKKRHVLEQAMQSTEIADMPVRLILRQTQVPVVFFWSS